MNALERVRKTVAGEPVDRLCVQPMVMMFAAKHLGVPYIDYTRDGRIMAEAQLKAAEDFELDAVITCSDAAREVIDIAGEGSVTWLEDQGPVIDESRPALAQKDRLASCEVPDPAAPGRMHDRIIALEIMHRALGGERSIVGWIEGPLALAQELRGLNLVMMDLLEDPDFVQRLLDFTAAVAMRYADAQVAAGADTIAMSDAAASMIGPDLYEQFLFPRQLQVMEHVKQNHPEVLTRLHMCGNTDPLIATMRRLPVDIYEIDFPAHLDHVREKLGPDRVISGNVSTITDLFEGTPESVYAACGRCHRQSGRHHIVNAGCEVAPATPPENLRAMVRYAKDHRPEDPPSAGS
jgi:MtaA/CmuA family methyltransferase